MRGRRKSSARSRGSTASTGTSRPGSQKSIRWPDGCRPIRPSPEIPFPRRVTISMTTAWRLFLDDPADGSMNMARDEVHLSVAERGGPPSLRLYAWKSPTLSLGAHQSAADADMRACRRLGVDLVRRPTGGGAVLHHHEITYAVTGRLGEAPFP